MEIIKRNSRSLIVDAPDGTTDLLVSSVIDNDDDED